MLIMQDFSLEICRKYITIAKNDETNCEWCNSHFAVRTPKGIHFYEFSHRLESVDKQLDFAETFVATPTSSPSSDVFDCKLVRNGLKNSDISDMMLDPAMWGHSDHLVHEMTRVLLFEFSPNGLICGKTRALAILNNIGFVEIYSIGRIEWNSILDLSSCVREQFEESMKVKPNTYAELKNAAYNLATCSICWSPTRKNDYCYFVTCQKSGVVLFWLVQNQGENINAKFCGKIELNLGEIIHTKWITRPENKFVLVCSILSGQVMALECQINKKHVTMLEMHMLWEHRDRMIAKFFEYHIEGNKILLFYNKHRHLVSQLLDESFNVISQSIDNINDYRLTNLTKNSNQIYVTTVNFKIYKINYTIESNVLHVILNTIDLKDISPTMELYSMRFSNNGVICVLTALDRRIMHRKTPLQYESIFIQAVPDDTIIDILLNNPTKRLTDYWDCIDLLRFRIAKLKILPTLDYDALLFEGETDVYKLKIYLTILKIYNSLVSNVKIANGHLAEMSIELVKDKILMVQAKSNISKLYDNHVMGKSMLQFDKECFSGSRNYLMLYCKKYESNLTDLISPDMLNLVTKDYKYTCQCCDEEINNFSCTNGHLNMFCSLTFTPIEDLEYVVCRYCNALARLETYSENPLCVYCDSYLENKFCF